MKVLRPGRQPAEWSKEVLCTGKGNGCKGCYALLLVGKEDLFKTMDNPKDPDWFITIKCPECSTLTDLDGQLHETSKHQVPAAFVRNLMPRLAWEAAQCPATTATESAPAPPDPNPDLIAVRRADLAELREAAEAVLDGPESYEAGRRLANAVDRLSESATGQGGAAS